MINLGRYFSLPSTLPRVLKSNFIYYYWDIGWWGLYTGATAAFLTIYAARCGATSEQIGLLTALPALLTLLLSLPAGRLLRNVSAKRATVVSAFVSRFLFVAYALLPWLFPNNLQVSAILGLAVISAIPNTVIGISFTQNFIECVPADWRGTVVGTRNAISSIVSFFVTVISGQILTHVAFPTGYQVVFFIGFIGGIMTVFQIARLQPIETPATLSGGTAMLQRFKPLPAIDGPGRTYLKVLGLLFLFNMTNNMVAPLVPNLLVNQLKLSDALIGVGTALSNILVLIVSLVIARVTRRTGNRRATVIGAGLLAFHAFALALSRDATLYLVATIVAGVGTGILNAAQYNYHLDNVPQEERSAWLSWALLFGNAAVLLGSLAGPAVARVSGTPEALYIFGALRFMVALLILRWG